MLLSAGGKLGRYEVLSPIGAGDMGEVYKARDTRHDFLSSPSGSTTAGADGNLRGDTRTSSDGGGGRGHRDQIRSPVAPRTEKPHLFLLTSEIAS